MKFHSEVKVMSNGTITQDIASCILRDLKANDHRINFASIGHTAGRLFGSQVIHMASTWLDIKIPPSFDVAEFAGAYITHLNAIVELYSPALTSKLPAGEKPKGAEPYSYWDINNLTPTAKKQLEEALLKSMYTDTTLHNMFKNSGIADKMSEIVSKALDWMLRNFASQELSLSNLFFDTAFTNATFKATVKGYYSKIDIKALQDLYTGLVSIHEHMVDQVRRTPIDAQFFELSKNNPCFQLCQAFDAATTGSNLRSEALTDVITTLEMSKSGHRVSVLNRVIHAIIPSDDWAIDIRDVFHACNLIEQIVLRKDNLFVLEDSDKATLKYIDSKLSKRATLHDLSYTPNGSSLEAAELLITELYVNFLLIRTSKGLNGNISSAMSNAEGWKTFTRNDEWAPALMKNTKMLDKTVSSFYDVYFYLRKYIGRYQEFLVDRTKNEVLNPFEMENFYYLYDLKMNSTQDITTSGIDSKNYFRELSTLKNHSSNFDFGEPEDNKRVWKTPQPKPSANPTDWMFWFDPYSRNSVKIKPFFNERLHPKESYKQKDALYSDVFEDIKFANGGGISTIHYFLEELELLGFEKRGVLHVPYLHTLEGELRKKFKAVPKNDEILGDFLTKDMVELLVENVICLFRTGEFGPIQQFHNQKEMQERFNLPDKAVEALTMWQLSTVEELLKHKAEIDDPFIFEMLRTYFNPMNILTYELPARVVLLPGIKQFEYIYNRPSAANQGRHEFTYARLPALGAAGEVKTKGETDFAAFIDSMLNIIPPSASTDAVKSSNHAKQTVNGDKNTKTVESEEEKEEEHLGL